MLFETLLGLIAFIPLLVLVRVGIRDKTYHYLMPSITYILGSILSWVIGFLGCLYFQFSLPGYGIPKHPITIMLLINLVTWGGAMGGIVALNFKKKDNLFLEIPSKDLSFKGFKVSSIIFVFLGIANVASGGMSRVAVEPGSPLYFLYGVSALQYLFFVFGGMCCSPPILSRKNTVFIVAPLLGALFYSLSGGREGTSRAIFFFLLGTFYSGLKFKEIKLFILAIIPLLITIIIVIGGVRGNSDFDDSSLGSRAGQIYTSGAQGYAKNGTDYDDPMYLLLTRIAEASGVAVIDIITENNTSNYIGLENLDRVIMIFVPKIFTGKKNYDDYAERIVKYGYFSTESSSAPMTLMADSFERGGYVAVLFISFLVSFTLTKLSLLLSRMGGIVAILSTLYLVIGSLRLYSLSLLGTINFMSASLARDTLLIYIFSNLFLSYFKQYPNKKY